MQFIIQQIPFPAYLALFPSSSACCCALFVVLCSIALAIVSLLDRKIRFRCDDTKHKHERHCRILVVLLLLLPLTTDKFHELSSKNSRRRRCLHIHKRAEEWKRGKKAQWTHQIFINIQHSIILEWGERDHKSVCFIHACNVTYIQWDLAVL